MSRPSANGHAAAVASHVDAALGFLIPGRHARGRVVRLGPALDAILAAHAYPRVVASLLAEALTLTALLGSTLKDADGQLTLQAQTQGGAIDLLVCDYTGGRMRGYVRHDPERLAALPAEPSLFALFGRGYLAITFDQATSGERYQGIVPLEGGSLAEAAEAYFSQSEQLPSLVRIAVSDAEGGTIAGGLLLQHLPEGEEGRDRIHARLDHPEWEHVATLAGTIAADELTDLALPLDRIIWRLFSEDGEVRVLPAVAISRGCRCSAAHFHAVIARFPAEERQEMADAEGVIRANCEFCSIDYELKVADFA